MAMHCENCGKSRDYGHTVSHAKNRTHRFFYPNLQHLKVVKDGMVERVKLCTKCIKRLKKDGRIGKFSQISPKTAEKVVVTPKVKVPVVQEKETKGKVEKEKVKESLDIASIVGKKS